MKISIQTLNEMSTMCNSELIDVVMTGFQKNGGIIQWCVTNGETNPICWNINNYMENRSPEDKYKFMVICAYIQSGGKVIFNDKTFDSPFALNKYLASTEILSIEDCAQLTTAMNAYLFKKREVFPEITWNYKVK